MQGRGGTWPSRCSNENCYGVPLYRQLLTGNDGKDGKPRTREWKRWFDAKCDVNPKTPQCRWPFIRMAGQNMYQRNTLTLNGGTYYLDTACQRGPVRGCDPRSPPSPASHSMTSRNAHRRKEPGQAAKCQCLRRRVRPITCFFSTPSRALSRLIRSTSAMGSTGSVKAVQVNLDVAPSLARQEFPTGPAWLNVVGVKDKSSR